MSLAARLKAKQAGEQQAIAINPPEWQPPPQAPLVNETVLVSQANLTQAEIKPPAQHALADVKVSIAGVECSSPAMSEPVHVVRPPPLEAVAKTKPAKKEKASAPPEAKATFTLCINCLPVGREFINAGLYFTQARQIIEKELNLADFRFAQYGNGPGILVQAVTKLLDDNPPDKAVVVDTRSPEGAICLELFRSRSTTQVIGY